MFTSLIRAGISRGRFFALAATLSAVLAAQPASAQEISEEHMSAARAALEASAVTDPFDLILPDLANRIKTEKIANRPDLSVEISTVVDEQALLIAPRRGDLEEEAARIYAKIFTLEELKAITVFFQSESGKKFLNEAPIISRQMGEASQIWAGGVFRDLAGAVTEEMKSRGLE